MSSQAALPSKKQVLSLYRSLLKGGNRFADYNFREYVKRCTREDFRKYKSVNDQAKLGQLYEKGLRDLGVVERQSFINQMYTKHVSIMDARAKEFRTNPDLFNKQYTEKVGSTIEEEED